MQKFKYMPSLPLSYERQGVIFFQCKQFRILRLEQQTAIRDACIAAAGGDDMKAKAIFTFVTTRISWRECCDRHFISDATLDRLRRKFYLLYDGEVRL